MIDQVTYLKSIGINAAAIFEGQEPNVLKDIEDGIYSHVYVSPESMLSMQRWRNMLQSPHFAKNCIVVAVDEAHCISHWGLPGTKPVPFRKWYGNLGELRSLFTKVNFIVCTATASVSTKRKIFDVLSLAPKDTFSIEMSPERKNLRYVKQYVDNNMALSDVFGEIICEVKNDKEKTSRTLIYCQTRKQCAILWRVFKLQLHEDMYLDSSHLPKDCLVQMFHAGTPDSTKNLILESVSWVESHIRILICTIAFGMGINCQGVHRVIHFGPSLNVECYLQECGRAGRDEQESICILLYNGFLSSHCSNDMRDYLDTEECRRQQILKHFSGQHEVQAQGCKCCDVCANKCCCCGPAGKCSSSLFVELGGTQSITYEYQKSRVVTDSQKALVKSKLIYYMNTLRNKSIKPVLYPNIFFEFGKFQIFQIIQNCSRLFSIADICNCVEIWRAEHAKRILLIISECFNDIDVDDMQFEDVDDVDEFECTVDSEWEDVRDDSHMNLLLNDTSNITDINEALVELDQSDQNTMDTSGIVNTLAIEVSQCIDTDRMDTC